MAGFPAAHQIMAVTLVVMGNSKNLRIFNFVILLENDNESTNQDDVTTDHEADVFGDTRCKIDQ